MKKIISSLLISMSLASCAYNPMPNSVSPLDNTGNYVVNIGQKQNGATLSAKIKLSNLFKTKGVDTNVHGKPVKTLADVRSIDVYLLALDPSYSGTDPMSDKTAIVNSTTSLRFSYVPDFEGYLGVKLTNVGETPSNKEYYIGVVAKDASGNVISKDGGAWTGSSLDSGLNISSTSVTVNNLLEVSNINPLSVSLTLKDAVGAEVASNINPQNGLIQAYGNDMLGFSTVAGGGLTDFGPSNIIATDNSLTDNIRGIATDSSGNVYFADETQGYISMVNKSGLMSVIATGLDKPVGLSVNESGDIVVVENGTTLKVTLFKKQSLGVYTKSSYNITSSNTIDAVYSVAFSNVNPNIVYVGSLPTITKVDLSTGTFSDVLVSFGDTGGIAVDSNDNLYISDFAEGVAEAGRLIKYNPNTDTTTVIATGLTSPDGVGVTYSGAVFVATDGNKIYKYKQSSSGLWAKDLFAGGGTLPGNTNGALSNQAMIGSIEMLAIESGRTLSGAPTLYYVDKTAKLVRKLVTSREPARKIAFSSNNQIYTIDSDGDSLLKITTGTDPNNSAVWSPDAKSIAFISDNGSSSYIVISNEDGTSFNPVTLAGGMHAYNPLWSPDGTKVLYAVYNEATTSSALYVYDTVSDTNTNITSSILSLVSGFEELGTYLQYASWSPDGSKITYSFRNEVYVMNPDGTGRTRLTNDTNVFVNPKFSPDGSKILVQSIASSSELDLFVINSDGSGSPTNLTSDISGRPTNASWSPDGSKIVYEFDDGSDDEIYTMDSDGANKSQLTDNAIDDNDPEYSPDGLKILFRSNSMLYTMSNTGNTVSQVSDKTAGDSNWSPI